MSAIFERKASHLELCTTRDVEHRGTTLLEEVHLLHEALPELAYSDVNLSTDLLGHRLSAPIVVSGMSGGIEEAGRLNRALALVAQKYGFAMGVGSQRAMLLQPERTSTFSVRDVAPDVPLLANLGAVQLRDASPAAIGDLVAAIGADALCVHLNPAQELVQDDGDRDFRGCLDAIERASAGLPVPVVVKETGCGLAPATLERLKAAGVRWVDVSGAGGTSWTGVEGMRGSTRQQALGTELREWGIPTAAAVAFACAADLQVIASGGIRGSLDAAKGIALGAAAVGLALPFLRAYADGGQERVASTAEQLIEGIRLVCVLCGARDLPALRRTPRVIGPALAAWLQQTPGAGAAG